MKPAPIPQNEKERLQKVMELGLLDSKQEERFDMITSEATKAFNVPISTITIIGKDREWYKSCQGLDVKQMPRSVSFCAYAMMSHDLFFVEDTLEDELFKDNPMVVGKPYIRFYAGVTLYSPEGINIGVFCIKDTKPKKMGTAEVDLMFEFAKRAELELNKKS